MRKNLLKNTYAIVAILLVSLFAMPTTTKAQMAFDLAIAGRKVTPSNCNDLTVLDGVAGKVSFDPNENVLTLEDATIETEGNVNAIYSKIEGLTIKVIGTNRLTSDKAVLTAMKPLTITGGGTLNVESQKDCALFVYLTELTIDDCTVNARSKAYGIAGGDGSAEKLIIRNANVTAEGTESGSIRDLAELVLIGSKIEKPAGAAFDAAEHCVALNGEMVKAEVIIKKDPTAISTPKTDKKVAKGTHTLSGVRVSDNLNSLSKGVYIVNGKKVVKQ